MYNFVEELKRINDLQTLILWKEQIKSQVIDSQITWHERMDLYKKVYLINERINQLEETSLE